jgi:cytochrome c
MNAARIALALAIGTASAAVLAQGTDLLRARGCLVCHDADRTKIGPALKDIRAKYKGDKSKAPDIVSKMKDGKGHPRVSGSDAELTGAVEQALGR